MNNEITNLLLTSLLSTIRGYIQYVVLFVAIILAIICIIVYSKQVKARKNMPRVVPASPCPICGSKMSPRVYTEGDKKGQGYWQCSQYPHCQGVADMVYVDKNDDGNIN